MDFSKKRLVQHIVYPLVIVVVTITVLIYFCERLLFPLHYWPIVNFHAYRNNIDALLITAVIKTESKFYPLAQSEAGAMGLMQIIPETAEWVAKEIGLADFCTDKLFDPEINIEIGAWYLGNLLLEFEGDVILALAAYNCGRGALALWLEEIESNAVIGIEDLPYAETRLYVDKVIRNHLWYKRIYPQKKGYSGIRSN